MLPILTHFNTFKCWHNYCAFANFVFHSRHRGKEKISGGDRASIEDIYLGSRSLVLWSQSNMGIACYSIQSPIFPSFDMAQHDQYFDGIHFKIVSHSAPRSKSPLFDELSIPFIDASLPPTPKTGRSQNALEILLGRRSLNSSDASLTGILRLKGFIGVTPRHVNIWPKYLFS